MINLILYVFYINNTFNKNLIFIKSIKLNYLLIVSIITIVLYFNIDILTIIFIFLKHYIISLFNNIYSNWISLFFL